MQNEATAKLPYIRHWHEKRSIKAKEKFIRFYYFVVQKKIPSSGATECQIQRRFRNLALPVTRWIPSILLQSFHASKLHELLGIWDHPCHSFKKIDKQFRLNSDGVWKASLLLKL